LRLRALHVVTVGRIRRLVTADGVAVTLASWRPCGCRYGPGAAVWPRGPYRAAAVLSDGLPRPRVAAVAGCNPPESVRPKAHDLASVPQGRTFRTSDAVKRRLPSVARNPCGLRAARRTRRAARTHEWLAWSHPAPPTRLPKETRSYRLPVARSRGARRLSSGHPCRPSTCQQERVFRSFP